MPENTPQNVATKFIKRLKVIITQKEIDEAQRANSKHCMIQQSLERDYPRFKRIWVDKNHVRFTDVDKNCIYTFQMPPRGRVMLLKWDAGEMVAPIDLWLHNPIVRERKVIGGYMRARRNEQTAKRHRGAIPTPKTKEARINSGRDRVFGRKQWSEELAKLRTDLGVS